MIHLTACVCLCYCVCIWRYLDTLFPISSPKTLNGMSSRIFWLVLIFTSSQICVCMVREWMQASKNLQYTSFRCNKMNIRILQNLHNDISHILHNASRCNNSHNHHIWLYSLFSPGMDLPLPLTLSLSLSLGPNSLLRDR